jgi:hypothetical protein
MSTGTDLGIIAVRYGVGHFGTQLRGTQEIIGKGDDPAWHRDRPQRITAVAGESIWSTDTAAS